MNEDTVSADGGKEEGTKVTEGGVYLQAYRLVCMADTIQKRMQYQ